MLEHTKESYSIRKEAEDFPMMVVLSFVYICNAKCPNCPYNSNSSLRDSYKDALFMSDEVFKKIADECGKYNSLLRLSGGGEPMLHKNAVQLMLYAKKKGCKIGLITNGSMFTENDLFLLIKNGIDAIEFSVDAGDEETYEIVRAGLSWKRLNETIKKAREIRDNLNSTTNLVCSIINQTGVDVKAAEAYWSSKVDKVQIRKYLTWGYNKDNSADPTPYLPPEKLIPCPWLFERLNIDSRGDVTLCGEDIAFAYKFDNIYNHSIKEIWLGDHFQKLRLQHLSRKGNEIEICSKCPDWKYRSWKYNYWKLLEDAQDNKIKNKGRL